MAFSRDQRKIFSEQGLVTPPLSLDFAAAGFPQIPSWRNTDAVTLLTLSNHKHTFAKSNFIRLLGIATGGNGLPTAQLNRVADLLYDPVLWPARQNERGVTLLGRSIWLEDNQRHLPPLRAAADGSTQGGTVRGEQHFQLDQIDPVLFLQHTPIVLYGPERTESLVHFFEGEQTNSRLYLHQKLNDAARGIDDDEPIAVNEDEATTTSLVDPDTATIAPISLARHSSADPFNDAPADPIHGPQTPHEQAVARYEPIAHWVDNDLLPPTVELESSISQHVLNILESRALYNRRVRLNKEECFDLSEFPRERGAIQKEAQENDIVHKSPFTKLICKHVFRSHPDALLSLPEEFGAFVDWENRKDIPHTRRALEYSIFRSRSGLAAPKRQLDHEADRALIRRCEDVALVGDGSGENSGRLLPIDQLASHLPEGKFVALVRLHLTILSGGQYKEISEFPSPTQLHNQTASRLAPRQDLVYLIRAIGLSVRFFFDTTTDGVAELNGETERRHRGPSKFQRTIAQENARFDQAAIAAREDSAAREGPQAADPAKTSVQKLRRKRAARQLREAGEASNVTATASQTFQPPPPGLRQEPSAPSAQSQTFQPPPPDFRHAQLPPPRKSTARRQPPERSQQSPTPQPGPSVIQSIFRDIEAQQSAASRASPAASDPIVKQEEPDFHNDIPWDWTSEGNLATAPDAAASIPGADSPIDITASAAPQELDNDTMTTAVAHPLRDGMGNFFYHQIGYEEEEGKDPHLNWKRSEKDLRFSNGMRLYFCISATPSLDTLPPKGFVLEDCHVGEIEKHNLIPRTMRQQFYPADYQADGLPAPGRIPRGRPAVGWDSADGCWRYVVIQGAYILMGGGECARRFQGQLDKWDNLQRYDKFPWMASRTYKAAKREDEKRWDLDKSATVRWEDVHWPETVDLDRTPRWLMEEWQKNKHNDVIFPIASLPWAQIIETYNQGDYVNPGIPEGLRNWKPTDFRRRPDYGNGQDVSPVFSFILPAAEHPSVWNDHDAYGWPPYQYVMDETGTAPLPEGVEPPNRDRLRHSHNTRSSKKDDATAPNDGQPQSARSAPAKGTPQDNKSSGKKPVDPDDPFAGEFNSDEEEETQDTATTAQPINAQWLIDNLQNVGRTAQATFAPLLLVAGSLGNQIGRADADSTELQTIANNMPDTEAKNTLSRIAANLAQHQRELEDTRRAILHTTRVNSFLSRATLSSLFSWGVFNGLLTDRIPLAAVTGDITTAIARMPEIDDQAADALVTAIKRHNAPREMRHIQAPEDAQGLSQSQQDLVTRYKDTAKNLLFSALPAVGGIQSNGQSAPHNSLAAALKIQTGNFTTTTAATAPTSAPTAPTSSKRKATFPMPPSKRAAPLPSTPTTRQAPLPAPRTTRPASTPSRKAPSPPTSHII